MAAEGMPDEAGGVAGLPALHAVGPTDDGGDLALVVRCRDGDAAAWRALYDRHFDFVARVARSLGTPREEVEDVAHDVFEVVLKRLDQFQHGRLTTWMYRITANLVSERHRRRRVRRAFQSLRIWIGGSGPEAPDRQAERRSAEDALGRVLERMSPKKREVFALFEIEGLDGEAIASRVGCPVNTVWTRLHHARKEFLAIGKELGVLDLEGTT